MLRTFSFRRTVLLKTLIVGAAIVGSLQTALAADKIDFAAQIQPLLINRCSKCHGAEKDAGKLRLHTAEAIKAFAEKELLVAGKPDESELFQRVTLPADDKKRMPKGADPLPKEEIDLIRTWIEQGALLTAVEAETPAAKEGGAEAAPAAEEPTPRPDLLAGLSGVAAASEETINKIKETGASVMPLFAGSPLLQVSYAQAEKPADDQALAALPAAADQIVWLNIAGAQASPVGYAHLAKLKNLNQLHLEKSNITDEGAAYLAELPLLEYLNLYDTTISDAAFTHLEKDPQLRKLYLWHTKVSYDVAMKWQEGVKGREASLGWDHPEIAKRRLTKQVEQAKQQTQETEARAKDLEAQLKAAQESQTKAAESLKQLEEELKKLTDPAAAAAPAADAPAAEAPAAEKPAEKPAEAAAN